MLQQIQKRQCGGCTACCKTHGISVFEKGNGEWCSKCHIGVGCAIYRAYDFPQECREYRCFWLDGKGSESDRPDRLKIVMDGREFNIDGVMTGIWNMWELEPGARLQPRVTQLTQAITAQGIVVRHYELLGVNNLRAHYFRPPEMSNTLFKKFLRVLNDFDREHTLDITPPRPT